MSSSIVSIVNITRNCLLRTNLRSEVIKRLLSSNSSNNNRVLLQKVNANEERFYEEPKRNYPMKLDSRELKLEPVVGTLEKSSYLDDCLSSRDIPHERVPGALEECTVDISHIVPSVQPTYNFAAYADKSPTIQQLVKLGVDLHQIEQDHDVFKFFLGLDFDKDIKPYIMFLHNCGVPADCIGEFITKNPKILMESLEDLTVRIRYLRAHKFGIADIARIVTDNPFWLMFSTKKIDGRLGFFQYEFQLTGQELRYLTVKCPKLMTRKLKEIREITFAVKEEMGFDQEQVKAIILAIPKLWRRNRFLTVDTFNYLHNVMKIDHETIVKQPGILGARPRRLENRYTFLKELNKIQFDPEKPFYISLLSIVEGSDAEFAMNVAKVAPATYELFLKTC